MKHLFHGTTKTDPKVIYESERGLDIKYAEDGLNGIGIYFADNSSYSSRYAHRKGNGVNQMFLCTVLTGVSTQKGGGKNVKKPPPMENKPNLDYDSINTGDGGHFIVYENNKAYPGYLITYL